jgi:hypothetical protein
MAALGLAKLSPETSAPRVRLSKIMTFFCKWLFAVGQFQLWVLGCFLYGLTDLLDCWSSGNGFFQVVFAGRGLMKGCLVARVR